MNEFEFLSVLVSILFGLGLTHLVAGSVNSIYRRRWHEVHLVFTGFTFMVLVLNWWTFFTWHRHAVWLFDDFLVLVFWALSNYALAIALYPPVGEGTPDFDRHHRWFLWSLVGLLLLDISQMTLRGDLWSPWYYLPFVLHYVALALLTIFVRSTPLRRVAAWWFLVSVVLWAFVVRRLLE